MMLDFGWAWFDENWIKSFSVSKIQLERFSRSEFA